MQNLLSAVIKTTFNEYSASKDILTAKKTIRNTTAHISFRNVVIFFSLIFFTISSCSPPKNVIYFQNLRKDTTLRNLVSKDYEPKIQKNDVLGITVGGLSPDIAVYNVASAGAVGGTPGPLNGYTVDENGNIQFIKLGNVHVEGLNRKEVKEMLEKNLVPYLKEVFVTVNFLNRHVTMLGGITPQVLAMPGNNLTILDALAASGDIADKGKIDNVLVIREKENDREFKRLNLTDNSIFYSPYFYLQPNDIVYVEPKKPRATNTAQVISYVTTGITFLIFILDRLKL